VTTRMPEGSKRDISTSLCNRYFGFSGKEDEDIFHSLIHGKVLMPFGKRTMELADVCCVADDYGPFHRDAMELLYKPDGSPRRTPAPDVLSFPGAHWLVHPETPVKGGLVDPLEVAEYIKRRLRLTSGRVTNAGPWRSSGRVVDKSKKEGFEKLSLLQAVFMMIYGKVYVKSLGQGVKALFVLFLEVPERNYFHAFNVRRGDLAKRNGGNGEGGGWFAWRKQEQNRRIVIWPDGVDIEEINI
jgi:hypothetical protein